MHLNFATALLVAVFAVSGAAVGASAQETPLCFGERATIVGTSGDDLLRGTDGPDVIHAGGGQDTVFGGAGADLICGGGNSREGAGDTLHGGAGNDKLSGGPGRHDDWMYGERGADVFRPGCSSEEGDRLNGGRGNDRLRGTKCGYYEMVPGGGDDHIFATSGQIRFPRATAAIYVDLRRGIALGEGRDRIEVAPESLTSRGPVSIVGTEHDDVLLGSSRSDSLDGGEGDDVIKGRSGGDWLIGGFGSGAHDRVHGGRGPDVITVLVGTEAYGGPGHDRGRCDPTSGSGTATFDGGPGRDWERFDAVAQRVRAEVDLAAGTSKCAIAYGRNPGSAHVLKLALENVENVFASRYGRLTAAGTAARNVIVGHRSDDTIRGRGGDDVIRGNRGSDTLDGGEGNDVVLAGDDPDTVEGGEGDDTLDGARGDDTMAGGDGDDTIRGGGGIDRADGGAGSDACDAESEVNCEHDPASTPFGAYAAALEPHVQRPRREASSAVERGRAITAAKRARREGGCQTTRARTSD